MSALFTWAGEYSGFIRNDRIFDAKGIYLGWIEEDGRVWRSDGHYLGDLTNENYILRRQVAVTPVPRVPRVPPVNPVAPVPRVNRVGKVPRVGRVDALEELLGK